MSNGTRLRKDAPMASAPFKYLPDGRVDWGTMWDSYCTLGRAGGPPHRGYMLFGQPESAGTPRYNGAVAEICRGIAAVSGLPAAAAEPGWIAVTCSEPAMAGWLAESIISENVMARADGRRLYVPVGADYTIEGEIKNVITVVAKTVHYWREHLPDEVKRPLRLQHLGRRWRARVRALLGRG